MGQIQIQQQLDGAQPSDVIQLPPETLDFPLIISKPCTVLGNGTIIDVSSLNEEYAVKILADNVVFSDVVVKNKKQTGFGALYIKSNQTSVERLSLGGDIGLITENSNNIDIIELKTFDASTGIKIVDSMNVDINACDSYNNSIGLDIIGSSSIQGAIDSYQGFGLNIQPTDISPLIGGKQYEFKLDGMMFSFLATQNMTYQDIVTTINSSIGFMPTYQASIYSGDIIIKTKQESILVEQTNIARSLIFDLSATPSPPQNNKNYSYIKFGLNITEGATAPIDKGSVYTFLLDGVEIQFFSNETDGTTYRELVNIIAPKVQALGYTIDIINGDIVITKLAVLAVTITNGTRFKNLFTTLGITTFQRSVAVIESYQGLGLNIQPNDATPLIAAIYSFVVNGIEYSFNNVIPNPTLNQVVALLNSNTTFKSKYTASIAGSDIRITANTPSILVEGTKLNIFSTLGVVPKTPIVGSEGNRRDRSHHINVLNSMFHNNQVGVRIINSNDILFVAETKIFSNTNIGLWQMPSSYNVKFRGEIYDNTNYGIRNTDKAASSHDVDAMDSWWGDRTGPAMFGPGEGDKISANVLWKPQRQNGTVPDLTYPKTRQFILGMLGYPLVKVELTDEQISMCIDKAIDKYMQYKTPEPTYRYINTGGGNAFVKLPLDMPKEQIIEVVYTPSSDIFSQLSGISGESFYLTYYLQNTGGTFLSDFYVAMAYRETMETTLGIKPTYEIISGKDIDGTYRDYLRLSPAPSTSLKIGILYSRPMTEEEVDSVSWIQKYSLAWAKEVLGRVRSKFASVPGPMSEMTLDGSTLLAESAQEIEKLEQQVIDQGEPLAFTTG